MQLTACVQPSRHLGDIYRICNRLNNYEVVEEHSRRPEPNDDEKPLKRPDIKGKYHLKDTYKNNNSINKNNNVEPSSSDNSKNKSEHNECKSLEYSEEKSSNSAKKDNETSNSNKCCIESILAKTEAIMDRT
ncbi:hypothetical protein NQ317_000940 [Molorchus minor]|uniref:Uncharacterized protein n=1 Tax=Molorchus minor TaxID=1323400 RepID=A0ABQ9JGA8_9CUCU|nr:hypothetical protein NQ317_000940 [Molorchus minor]